MLKKRVLLLVLLLGLSIAGQVALRPCLGGGENLQALAEPQTDNLPPAAEQRTGSEDSSDALPPQDQSPDLQSQLWRQFFYLLGFVALIGGAGWFICRKFACGFSGTGQLIRIGETTRLGPRKALHLVRVGAKTFLIASAGDSVSLLADVSGNVPSLEEKADD